MNNHGYDKENAHGRDGRVCGSRGNSSSAASKCCQLAHGSTVHSPQNLQEPRMSPHQLISEETGGWGHKWGNWRLRADCRLPPKVTSCVKTLCLCRWIRNMESPASLLGKDPLILEVLWKVHINSISLSSHFQPESECVTKLLSELTSRLTSVAGPRRAPGLGLFWSKSARHPSELSSPLRSWALAYWFRFWKTILELAMSYK